LSEVDCVDGGGVRERVALVEWESHRQRYLDLQTSESEASECKRRQVLKVSVPAILSIKDLPIRSSKISRRQKSEDLEENLIAET
jgi:hypothetical protein